MTKEELLKLYERLKEQSRQAINKGSYDLAITCLFGAGYISYTFGLDYTDDEIESLLNVLSGQIRIKQPVVNQLHEGHRCVFLDGLSAFRGGLTVQYLRAIKATGWDVLYISDQDLSQKHRAPLVEELKTNPRLSYTSVPKKNRGLQISQFIYDAVMGFGPDNVIVHIPPFDSYIALACYALPSSIKKFMVNYTDHSFLLGTGCMDYSFEFRNYGASISNVYRHFEPNKLLMLPYYAFSEDVLTFQGLPEMCKGKTVFFSGGNFWKIIDDNDTFFIIVKRILDAIPDAVFLLAGRGNEVEVNKAVARQKLDNRFVTLGWRQDISELVNHCDIYVSTYPHGGGLMGQFAARAGKPILAYDPAGNKEIEHLTCQIKMVDFSFTNMDRLIEEAVRLAADDLYRKEKGEQIKECVLREEQFNELFINAIITCQPTGLPIEIDGSIQKHADEYIQGTIKSYSNGRFVKFLVRSMGKYAKRVLPVSYIMDYYKLQLGSAINTVGKKVLKIK